ncbi:MAG: hypothetical protein U1F05_13655 [Burkholderiales bacterium]
MTHQLTVTATYKTPPGHNRLIDVTLLIVASLTNNAGLTIEFDEPTVDPLSARMIGDELRNTISLDAIKRGVNVHVTILSPSPVWVVPQCCGFAAADAGRQLRDMLSSHQER